MSVQWLAESLDDGVLSARVGRDGDRLVAEWPGRACVSVNRDGTDMVVDADPEADAVELEKLQRGAVRLLLAHLGGAIPLHASAVAIGGRAVVLVGGTGLGKSTLAAALCDSEGASLLADDAVVIERRGDSYEVLAVEEKHWLDREAAGALGRPNDFGDDKVPLDARRADVRHARLALIAHLAFSNATERPRLVPLVGLDAVGGLLSQLTRFVVDDPAVARRDLCSLSDLVNRTRIARLDRPRRLEMLRETAAMVASAIHGETDD